MQIRARIVELLRKKLDSIQRMLSLNGFENCAHRSILCTPITALRISSVNGCIKNCAGTVPLLPDIIDWSAKQSDIREELHGEFSGVQSAGRGEGTLAIQ